MTFARTLLLLLLAATTARADVWKRASDPEPQLDFYEALMTRGDDAAIAANARSINLATILKNIDIAVEAYRGAAKARKSAEPYFRIASVLNSFFFDCLDPFNVGNLPKTCHAKVQIDQRAKETLDAWDTFEALAPLDPRVNEILLARAILRTKLVASTPKPEALLRAAAKDYQALIDREDGVLLYSAEMVLGNLAETHMMLGNIDEAIDAYRLAIKAGGGASTIYGLAVAYDRDGRGDQALQIIRGQGVTEFAKFEDKFDKGFVFFVPAGEEEYYFGLAHEAFGNVDEAITRWRAFIRSGAHPQFQPRAKEHLDKLMTRKNLKWKVPITPDLEEPRLQNPKRRLRK